MSACYVASTELSPQKHHSFNYHSNPKTQKLHLSYFIDEETESQREVTGLRPHSWQSVVPSLKPRCDGLQSLCSLKLSMFRTSPLPTLLTLALFLPPLWRKCRIKVCYLCVAIRSGWSILESPEKEWSFSGCASAFSSWLVPVRLHSQELLSGAGGLQQLSQSSEVPSCWVP